MQEIFSSKLILLIWLPSSRKFLLSYSVSSVWVRMWLCFSVPIDYILVFAYSLTSTTIRAHKAFNWVPLYILMFENILCKVVIVFINQSVVQVTGTPFLLQSLPLWTRRPLGAPVFSLCRPHLSLLWWAYCSSCGTKKRILNIIWWRESFVVRAENVLTPRRVVLRLHVYKVS